MKALLLMSIGIFAVFLAYYWLLKKDAKTGKRHGMQVSISATYKLLLKQFPKAAHSIWIGLFLLLAIGIVSAGGTAWHFGGAIGLLGVGAFPGYWEKDEVKKHIGSAYLAYLVIVVYMLFFDGSTINTILSAAWLAFAALCSFKVLKIDNATAVYELVGFGVIVVGLL